MAFIAGIIILLIAVVLPIAGIVFIVQLLSKRNKDGKEESTNDYAKRIRYIYTYFILICLLCAIIGGVIGLFNSTVNYFLQEEPYEYYDEYYEDYEFDVYYEKYSNSQHTKAIALERERNQSIVNISTAIATLICTIPLFIYHSNLAKTENIIKNKKETA